MHRLTPFWPGLRRQPHLRWEKLGQRAGQLKPIERKDAWLRRPEGTYYVRACHPTAIGAIIIAGVAAAGVTVPATVTIAGTEIATAAIVGTAVVLGVSITGELLLTQRATSKAKDGQQNLKQDIPPRRRYYGQVKAGGVFNFREDKDGVLYECLLINEGEIDGIIEHWLNDDALTLSGNAVTVPTTYVINSIERVHIYTKLGTDTQTAHSQLTSAFSGIWTSDHQALGVFNVLLTLDSVKADKYQKIYPAGVPTYRTVFRSNKVWDPRINAQFPDDKSTWAYQSASGPDQGENAVLCLLDYLRHRDGAGIPSSYFTSSGALAEWRTAATVADELVTLKNGGTEPRYRLAGGYEVPQAPKDVIPALASVSDSWVYLRGDGAIGIRPGIWEEPTVTINDDHILAYTLRQGRGLLRGANIIRAKYVSRDHDYQPTDADPWREEEAISNQGEELERQIDLTWCPSHSQARRLMKLEAHRTNAAWLGQIRTNLYGLNALGERRINLVVSELGISMPFEITSFDIDVQAPACVIGVQSMISEAWNWNPQLEEGTAPPAPAKNTDHGTIEAFANFTANAVGTHVELTWDAPSADNLDPFVQYQLDGAGSWLTLTVGSGNNFVQTPNLASGLYDFRGRWETSHDEGSFSTIDNVTV